MQTANMDSCSLSLDYKVSSDSCTYLVFAVKTLLKQFPFRPIPGKLPPPVWCEWVPRKSLGPLWKSCTIWCEVLPPQAHLWNNPHGHWSGSTWGLEKWHGAMQRSGRFRGQRQWQGTSAPRSKCLKNTGDLVFYLWLQKCTRTDCLGNDCKDERWREFLIAIVDHS